MQFHRVLFGRIYSFSPSITLPFNAYKFSNEFWAGTFLCALLFGVRKCTWSISHLCSSPLGWCIPFTRFLFRLFGCITVAAAAVDIATAFSFPQKSSQHQLLATIALHMAHKPQTFCSSSCAHFYYHCYGFLSSSFLSSFCFFPARDIAYIKFYTCFYHRKSHKRKKYMEEHCTLYTHTYDKTSTDAHRYTIIDFEAKLVRRISAQCVVRAFDTHIPFCFLCIEASTYQLSVEVECSVYC